MRKSFIVFPKCVFPFFTAVPPNKAKEKVTLAYGSWVSVLNNVCVGRLVKRRNKGPWCESIEKRYSVGKKSLVWKVTMQKDGEMRGKSEVRSGGGGGGQA